MFSNQKSLKQTSTSSKEQSKLAAGTVVTGDIVAKGPFRIEGTLEGNLQTTGKVVISETGIIKGSLHCENADVEGKVTGKVQVNGALTLRSTASVSGEVAAGNLSVEPGAGFNVTCEMNAGVKPLKPKGEQKSA